MDKTGKILLEGSLENGEGIDISLLSSGIYILELNTSRGVQRNRFIKL